MRTRYSEDGMTRFGALSLRKIIVWISYFNIVDVEQDNLDLSDGLGCPNVFSTVPLGEEKCSSRLFPVTSETMFGICLLWATYLILLWESIPTQVLCVGMLS